MLRRAFLPCRAVALAALVGLAVPCSATAQGGIMIPPYTNQSTLGPGYGFTPMYPAGGYGYTPGYYPVLGSNYSSYYVPSNYPVLLGRSPTVPQEPAQDGRAHLLLHVPAGAEVWFDDHRTRQTGDNREFISPPLTPGQEYSYDVRVRWTQDGRTKTRERTIPVQANVWREVDFTKPTS